MNSKNLNKNKKDVNPGIKKAVERAAKELTAQNKCFIEMFIYIDGDPDSERIVYLN